MVAVYKGDSFQRVSIEYPGVLRRVSSGLMIGGGLTLKTANRAQLFVKLTGSLSRTQALRDGLSFIDNDPTPRPSGFEYHVGPPPARPATLRPLTLRPLTLTLTVGLTLGAPSEPGPSADQGELTGQLNPSVCVLSGTDGLQRLLQGPWRRENRYA